LIVQADFWIGNTRIECGIDLKSWMLSLQTPWTRCKSNALKFGCDFGPIWLSMWHDPTFNRKREREQTLMNDAYIFAVERHGDQKYGDDKPYVYHLNAVQRVLIDACFDDAHLLQAALLHDVVEDTETTIDEVREIFGGEVASLVWAVTGTGENRRVRNRVQYAKIAAFPRASFLKVADRIANLEAVAAERKTSLAGMYLKESAMFEAMVVTKLPSCDGALRLMRRYYAACDAVRALGKMEESG
jgi:hypothetical protein